ncbi:hypothetical protein Kpol_1000p20 [Vanderwaltozyma polyspora DSM 70294]|uniref:DHHA2 domain-containing protein n=1 Tax=Vanderwaltozyma polyspora (strain ATCC 22028 / DSM 70294 / BCRC 21397 / CBS 2163 / NBRC 10782 / NRRL Y-8283 / UCD 57-17) TaxID=436907 RepID=A7TPW0_VANPO|nr:uncharacterized protein Kpol_1000p20 [Vanderwaltozyma polyspora DSM 70294]EDO15708.1 hypothetical protein Kpol_1000p20 [Vanderwaltozyma polyspora DSM 70294]
MSQTLKSFLLHLRNNYITKLGSSSRLKIAIGNESADFDSVVSAIGYAYCDYISGHQDGYIVPVINVNRPDLKMRRDIVFALQKFDIDDDLLFFKEDLEEWSGRSVSIEAVLVDHNVISRSIKEFVGSISSVIDHHKDEGLYLDATPRIVKTTGSCSSLVFNYWQEKLGNNPSLNPIVPLLLGAVLIDTSNYQYKVETPDIEALERYKMYPTYIERNRYYEELKTAKDDIKGLSIIEILRKDYKQFVFTKNNTKITIGIASIVKSMDWLYNEYNGSQNFEDGCLQFLNSKDIDILLLMTAWSDENGFNRELVAIPKPEFAKLSNTLINQVNDKLELKPVSNGNIKRASLDSSPTLAFKQLNTQASRKQVAPYIEEAFKNLN